MRKINLENTNAVGKQTIKEINQRLILNLIREHQPISRVDISKKTKLQKSTVTIITNRLLDRKWIYEGENGLYGGGRRPKNLYLNSEKFHAVGVEIGKDDTTLALADLNGKLLDRQYLQTDIHNPRFFVRLAQKIRRFSDRSMARTGIEVAGIGVGLPGYIEKATGKVIAAENFGWMNIPVGDHLRGSLDLPLYFENNAKLSAFAEIWFGANQNGSWRNFVYITTRDGLGTSIIINGEIYNGARDGAAEFGHFSLFPYGEQCVCGNQGCWEMYASDMATVRRYFQAKKSGSGSLREHTSIGDVIERAHRGELAARKALQSTARYLGLGITNLIFGFNPEMVILGDELVRGWDLIGEIIISTVSRRVPRYYSDSVKIAPSSIKERPALLGAVALVLAHVFTFFENL